MGHLAPVGSDVRALRAKLWAEAEEALTKRFARGVRREYLWGAVAQDRGLGAQLGPERFV